MRRPQQALIAVLSLVLGGCGSLGQRTATPSSSTTAAPPAETPAAARRGGYYLDDGPGANPPDLTRIADAQPRAEPLHRAANRPYRALGKDFVPLASARDFRQRGRASWYGTRYHGQKTSSGEPYDMYGMTGAHPVLPIPSYARVTNLENGRSVVVRINDRGPFLSDRIIDLSYVAAWKLGYVQAGSALVEVQSLAPGEAAPPPVFTERAAVPVTLPERGVEPLPAAAPAAGIYLQVGAFAEPVNAENLRARIARDYGGLAARVELLAAERAVPATGAAGVLSASALYRVQLGPFASHSEAEALAERLRSELKLAPAVLRR